MIRRLRWKVVAITMGFSAAILLAVFAGVFFTARTSLRQNAELQLQQALQSANPDFFRPGQGEGNLPCFVAEVYPSGTARISGSSYYQLDEALLGEIVAACLQQEEDSGVLEAYHLRYLRQSSLLSLRIAFTDSSIENSTLRALVRTCLIIGLAAIAVLLLCCYFLSGLITAPVERAWESQRRFISDASHELKTPLTVVLSSAQLLEAHTPPHSEAAPYLDNIRAEGQRMRALVEDMLTLSRTESGQKNTPLAALDLSDLVTEAALRFEPVAFEAGRHLRYDIESALRIRGDREALTRLIGILLDNAIKYAPADTAVTLALRRQERQAVLTVENGGEPIAPQDLPHLFERFYRADRSRSDHGSFGLGLSIAQAVVRRHSGTIRAESDSRATRFTVALPLEK